MIYSNWQFMNNEEGQEIIPKVGFGTWLITNQDAERAVYDAIKIGYRHIDTAEAYQNEEGVGRGLRTAIAELGISRQELFVTTKLWPGGGQLGPAKTYETTMESCLASLAKLQLDYVDLYLIHAPVSPEQRLEQWKALVELKQKGKVKAIGVSNYNKSHILEIKEAGLPNPQYDQIELHPWSQKPALTSYLKENGIIPIAYSSLVPLSTWRVKEGQNSAKTDEMRSEGARDESPFKKMAIKYGVSEAQILLRWGIQKEYPIIPKSTNPERMSQNIDLFSFEIDEIDMQSIESMDKGDGVAWSMGDPTNSE